jgi:methyl-accepting chemotaxis protein
VIKQSFKFKLVIGGILIVLIPLVITGFFSINKASKALVDAGMFQVKQIAQDIANMTELVLEEEKKYAMTMAVEPFVVEAAEKTLTNGVEKSLSEIKLVDAFFAKALKQSGGAYELIILADANGNTIADSMGGALRDKKISIKDRGYFQIAKKGKPNIGEPVISKASGNPVVVAAAPIKTDSGDFAGVLGAVLKLDALSETITKIKVGKTGYPFMVNKKGFVIAHPNKKHIMKLDLTKLEGMESITKQMLAQKTGVDEYVFKGIHKTAGFAPVPITNWSVGVTQNQDEFKATGRSIRNIIFVVGGISLVLTILGILLFTKSIMTQLGHDPSEIARIAESIAKGDLTVEFNASGDKTTGVYKNMEKMTQDLSHMFKDISMGVQTLTSSSTELSAVSEQISTNADQTAENSNSVASAAEEMSTNMSSVAAASEQTTANIQMIVAASEEMTATINEIANNTAKGSETTSQAVQRAEEVSEKVDELGKAALEINKVTETIADIAAQTNLLALNATIEAARAGDAGKGFAVVAQEIKSLALQTDEATKEISEKISSVQTTSTESVAAIESIVKVINDINDIVTTVATAIEEQSATTQEISDNVSQIAEGIQEVNENINQTSAVTGEVTQNITNVSQSADEVKTGSQQVMTSASELSKLAENLNEMVGRFKI